MQHYKKQRALVDRLVDRVDNRDAGLRGAAPRRSALPDDEGGFEVDFSDNTHDDDNYGNEEELSSTLRSLKPPEPSSVELRDVTVREGVASCLATERGESRRCLDTPGLGHTRAGKECGEER